uniref:Cytochrome P450 n=1 Tax=Glossina brevipalpis TaxID=37001 RepID=A0A1A9X3E8_9MUSC
MAVLQIFCYVLLALLPIAYYFLRRHSNYFAVRNIPHIKPVLFYGNMRDVSNNQHLKDPFLDLYKKFKAEAPFAGFYLSMRKAVVLLDLDLIKNVLITDFHEFSHRGNYYNVKDDPLSGHLFNLDGPKWKQMRSKLTPTFTSGKMKFMFGTVVDVGQTFVKVLKEILEKESSQNGLEMGELLGCFTTDVIGSCAFGLDCNSLKDPETQFRLMGKKAFSKRRHGRLVVLFMQAFPNISRRLGLCMTSKDVSDFFYKVVKETVEYREKEQVQRNDFMNLLLELRKGDGLESLSLEEIAAQSFVFFLAGFETSASTMAFALYELAINQQIQEQSRQEVRKVLEKYNNSLTYESLKELNYLQKVLNETMRKYSVASILIRKALNDYQVPGSKFIIEKGTLVIIPVDAIHHDPDIYPNPEEFQPERFNADQVNNRHGMSWLPFGDGPRNCIGLRFGKLQTMIGLALLLNNFYFTLNPRTPVPMIFNPKSFVLAPKGGIHLNIEKIQ